MFSEANKIHSISAAGVQITFFGPVIFLAFFLNYKTIFRLDENWAALKEQSLTAWGHVHRTFQIRSRMTNCKTAKILNYASTTNNILSCTLSNITSNTGWKIIPWIMHLEDKMCWSSDVLVTFLLLFSQLLKHYLSNVTVTILYAFQVVITHF